MRCEECGTPIERWGYEYLCPSCGLVYDVVTIHSYAEHESSSIELTATPRKLGSSSSKKYQLHYSTEEKRLAQVLEYINYYAQNLPRHILNRATHLARKYLRVKAKEGKRISLEAFAIACLERALREEERGTILTDIAERSLRSKARKYYSELFGPLFTDMRKRAYSNILELCMALGVKYEDCLEVYHRYETFLSSRTPRVAAAIVVYLAYPQLGLTKVSKVSGIRFSILRDAINKLNEKAKKNGLPNF